MTDNNIADKEHNVRKRNGSNRKRPPGAKKPVKRGRGRKASYNVTDFLPHIAVLAVILILIIAAMVMIHKWNKGQKSDYDPNEVTTEFDTEPNDFIVPLSSQEIEGKTDDGVFTIMTLGNSPFADGYPNNNLATALAEEYDASVINCGIDGSYITCLNTEYSEDDPEDGVSLPWITKAIETGDFSIPEAAATKMSDHAVAAVDTLKNADMSSVDTLLIMYNLEDYRDHRPLGSESVTDITCIYGAVRSSIEAIRRAYPHIRVVYLSQPAGGVTIDDFFVDGDLHDIGEGVLNGYVTFELEATAAASGSFIDIYYGAIGVDDRDKYLVDDYHINDAGAKAIAARVHKLITPDL
ncbi:MAG: hypothetical protein K6E68_10280 [Lachnospiraceae bacterium]|nr:hypothetical protein [Lachnospiraceae bacterium]